MRRNRIHFRLAIAIASCCFAGLLRPASGQGRVFWEEGGVELCDGTANTGQSVVSDSKDGAIVIWSDSRGDLSSVYAQRVNREGEIVWPRNGVLLRNNLGATGFLPAVADGHGGAVAVWPDVGGYPFLSQLTAQRVDSAGEVLWGELGVTIVGTNEDREFLPALVSDGRGGAIVAWTMFNHSGGNDSLQVSRLDSEGALKWTTLVRSDTLDVAPYACSDGRGGIVVAWHEKDAGRWVAKLQLVDSAGQSRWGEGGSVQSRRLHPMQQGQLCCWRMAG